MPTPDDTINAPAEPSDEPALLKHQTHVAGVKFRKGAAEKLEALRGEDVTFTLEPEPTNPYDSSAVKVLHDGEHVGYVPKDLSPQVSALIRQGRIESAISPAGRATYLEIHYRKA